MVNIIDDKIGNTDFILDYNYTPTDENIGLTSIVILTYNQLNYTKMCIDSIRKFTQKDSYEIIIVDNNSSDNTVKWLKKQSDIRVIYNHENKGFPAGCNQGIEIAKGDNILLLNNDTIVTPNWLNNLYKALYSSEYIGAVGAISNSCSNGQQIDINYESLTEMLDLSQKINISNQNSWDLKNTLIGYCLMIKKEVLNKVGLLDELFTPGNFEDNDLSFRIIENGYKLLLCKDVFIHHFGSISFKNNPEFVNIFNKNNQKFKEKWDFDPSYFAYIRFEIINLIQAKAHEKINVLEVGCGTGSSLLEIKNRYKNAQIYGVEICEGPAKISKGLFDTKVGDIEILELDYEEGFFDYIIFGDVLEHLKNPWATLTKIKKYLKKDGFILASIPNIMHISVIRDLLYGRFIYRDSGILDKTHLRFFTLTEIQDLFNSINFNLELINASALVLDPAYEKLIDQICSITDENLKQQFMAYQYIVKAREKDIIDINHQSINQVLTQEIDKLKLKLIKIDNNIDIKESLDYILSKYEKYEGDLVKDIKELIEKYVINKDVVLESLIYASNKNNLSELSSLLNKD